MKIYFKKEDLFKCLEFAVNYFLDEGKSNVNRTTGQTRGLGAVINDFLLGKIVEIGVGRAIEASNEGIKCLLDFDIHPINKKNAPDPDVVGVLDGEGERAPRAFVEVKNVSENDRWVGLSQEQFTTLRQNSIIDAEAENLYLIYASIKSNDNTRNPDLLGSFLKSETKNELFEKFCNIEDVYLEIECIITGKELINFGTKFDKGSCFYETEIVSGPLDEDKVEKIREARFNKIEVGDKIIFKMRQKEINNKPPKEIGDIDYNGKFKIYEKENEKSYRFYIDCESDVILKNNILGEFKLEAGKMYELVFDTMGRDPILKRNNLWIANRNLKNIFSESVENRIREIAEKI